MVLCQLLSDVHLEFYDGNPGRSRDKEIERLLKDSNGAGAKYLFPSW